MIAIFTDYKKWSGVDVLVGRFAEFLRSRGIEFTLVANGPSRLRDETPSASVMTSEELGRACCTGKVSHLYLPSASMLRHEEIPWRDLGQTRVSTLVVQPYEPLTRFVPAVWFAAQRIGYSAVPLAKAIFPWHFKRVGELFRLLVEHDALYVMDGASAQALSCFFPRVPNAKYIPIPTSASELGRRDNDNDRGRLSVAYFGRLDEVKWAALQPVIAQELAPLSSRHAIEFHAVADGICMTDLAAECSRAGIKFRNHGVLPNAEARARLIEVADVAVAMGTSALDLAGSGLPCIIIDSSLRPKAPPQRLFHFVHEVRAYTLGEYRDFPGYDQHGRSFAQCVALARQPSTRAAELEYTQRQHSPERCFQITLEAILTSRMSGEVLAAHLDTVETSYAKLGRWYRWVGTDGQWRFSRRA